jgi:hypothetical protein
MRLAEVVVEIEDFGQIREFKPAFANVRHL